MASVLIFDMQPHVVRPADFESHLVIKYVVRADVNSKSVFFVGLRRGFLHDFFATVSALFFDDFKGDEFVFDIFGVRKFRAGKGVENGIYVVEFF